MDQKTAAKLGNHLGEVICALVGCESHELPYTRELPDSAVALWYHLSVKAKDGGPMLQSLSCIFDHVPLQRLGPVLQSAIGRHMIEAVLKLTRAPERQVRIAAG